MAMDGLGLDATRLAVEESHITMCSESVNEDRNLCRDGRLCGRPEPLCAVRPRHVGIRGIDVEDDGRFAIPVSLPSYWEGPDASKRHPFLVRADCRLAGFALIGQIGVDPVTWDMGEFFILRKYRRSGLGRQVAYALFDGFAEDWEVRELPSNTMAQAFWRRASPTTLAKHLPRGRSFSRRTAATSSSSVFAAAEAARCCRWFG
jgi:predicted acetyltransferase